MWVHKTATENRLVVATAGSCEQGIDHKDERTFGGDENTLYLNCGDVCTTVYIFQGS